MKEDGNENTGKDKAEEEKRKKAAGRPKKSHNSALGGLPSSMDDAKRTAAESDSGVARGIGGIAVAPAMHQMAGLSGVRTPGAGPLSHAGAKLAPSASMMAPLSGGGGPSQRTRSGAGRTSSSTTSGARAAPFGWKFQDVPALPEFHPLERSAVFVPHCDAPEVGRRVAEVLKARSISAVYDDKKAKAKCVTEDNVEFRVRLYRGRNKFSHGVIVEVQRRFGFSPVFAGDMYAILDAAEGKPPAPETLPLIPTPDKLVSIVSDIEDDLDDDLAGTSSSPGPYAGGKRKAGSASLRIASEMLKRSKTADANALALESLASLTDPSKMGAAAALRVSRQILTGSDGADIVRDAVVSLLVDRTLEVSETTSEVWEEDEDGLSELRLRAMTVLCNAITVTSAAGSPALLKERANFLSEDVVPVLAEEIRGAKKNPRMAVAAARCLEALLNSRAVGRVMIEAAIELDMVQALEVAQDVGQRGNDHLAEISTSCLSILS